jgi:hypothetical protein
LHVVDSALGMVAARSQKNAWGRQEVVLPSAHQERLVDNTILRRAHRSEDTVLDIEIPCSFSSVDGLPRQPSLLSTFRLARYRRALKQSCTVGYDRMAERIQRWLSHIFRTIPWCDVAKYLTWKWVQTSGHAAEVLRFRPGCFDRHPPEWYGRQRTYQPSLGLLLVCAGFARDAGRTSRCRRCKANGVSVMAV